MRHPRVSVIIPAYNQAEFLGDAIQSVLDQTYQDFEIIIVNDASPDRTSQVVEQFDDARILYLVHETNQMLAASRNTGIRAASGEIIALLDADDIFHPEKLEKHVAYLDANPEVGATYNPRFVLNHSQTTIRELERPPLRVTLEDLVLGFPFAPSDMVTRRDWLFQVGLFDETFTSFSEDLDLNCQLALAGCTFASVDRALNYRRYHSARIIRNISDRVAGALRSLEKTFSDPRFPASLLPLRDKAISTRLAAWSILEYLQGDTALGQEAVSRAVQLSPSLLEGAPCELLAYIIEFCTMDDSLDHEVLIRGLLEQLPREMEWLDSQADWAVARGYLMRATRAVMWGRPEAGEFYFSKASSCNAQIDHRFLIQLTMQIASYESEFGPEPAQIVLKNISQYLRKMGGREKANWLRACYAAKTGFESYAAEKYDRVPGAMFQAIMHDPSFMLNRGAVKILATSLAKYALQIVN
jgi:glycosyltransferase involved in cell wall biosynthesis